MTASAGKARVSTKNPVYFGNSLTMIYVSSHPAFPDSGLYYCWLRQAAVLQLHHHKAHKSAAKRAATDLKAPLQPITCPGQGTGAARISPRS